MSYDLGAEGDPVAEKELATTTDLNALYVVNDNVRYLMMKWNSFAGPYASEAMHQTVRTKVSQWMAAVSEVRRLATADNRPLREPIINLRKAGALIDKEFRLSLAYIAPATFAAIYAPKVLSEFKLTRPLDVLNWPAKVKQVVTEAVAIILAIAWTPVRGIWRTVMKPVAVVSMEVTKDVMKGVEIGGKRVIGTLDFLSSNLTPILIGGAILYFALPVIMTSLTTRGGGAVK